jgi:hypothetical protein
MHRGHITAERRCPRPRMPDLTEIVARYRKLHLKVAFCALSSASGKITATAWRCPGDKRCCRSFASASSFHSHELAD